MRLKSLERIDAFDSLRPFVSFLPTRINSPEEAREVGFEPLKLNEQWSVAQEPKLLPMTLPSPILIGIELLSCLAARMI